MKDYLIMKKPASWHRDMYREGAQTGNGKIGALVYGGIAQETIVVNHSRLWSLGKVQELPDIHECLEKTRQGIDSGDYWNSNWIGANALKEKGYAPKLGTPCSLCDIHIDMKDRKPFSKYRRIVRMDSGEVTVSWKESLASYERNLFVSRCNDSLFYEIKSCGAQFDMLLWLDMHETYEDDAKNKRSKLVEENSIASYSYENYADFYAKHENNTYYGAFGKVTTDGSIIALPDGKLSVTNATRMLLVLKPFINAQYEEAMECTGLIPDCDYIYEEEKNEHVKLHGSLYHSVELELEGRCEDLSNEQLLDEAYEEVTPIELLEKQWKFGRYLMICGTCEDGLPFPLYGLWHGRYSMPWPHNMANENVQMIYWHTMSGGLTFAVKTLIHYYVERMDDFRECAKKLFGLPGIFMPAGTTPGNSLPNQIVPVIMNWIGCAGWISQHFYEYYLYTKDEETLQKEILPFMLEAAEFYEHYLVKEASGTYRIYPSVSPENTPGNLIPKDNEDMAHPCPSVVNATMDVAIIKELMTNLIDLTKNRKGYKEKAMVWKDITTHLPQYVKTEDGDIKEWLYPGLEQRYNHRHLSHIYPVFPGREIVKGQTDEELMNAFEKAVDKRILGAQTGWSLAHMACIYARFEKPEKAMECLDILSKSCLLNNLFTLHNDWRGMGLTLGRGSFAPIQLDAVMGTVQAIQEMLLYSGNGVLKLLPAIPNRLNKGSIKNLRFMDGRINMEWDLEKKTFHYEINAERDTKFNLYLPKFIQNTDTNVENVENGQEITLLAGEKITSQECTNN